MNEETLKQLEVRLTSDETRRSVKQKNGISIPYPQMDVHVVQGS